MLCNFSGLSMEEAVAFRGPQPHLPRCLTAWETGPDPKVPTARRGDGGQTGGLGPAPKAWRPESLGSNGGGGGGGDQAPCLPWEAQARPGSFFLAPAAEKHLFPEWLCDALLPEKVLTGVVAPPRLWTRVICACWRRVLLGTGPQTGGCMKATSRPWGGGGGTALETVLVCPKRPSPQSPPPPAQQALPEAFCWVGRPGITALCPGRFTHQPRSGPRPRDIHSGPSQEDR